MLPNLLIAAILSATWQTDTIDAINVVRAEADNTELALYGVLLDGPRKPLILHDGISTSAQWWCDALKGTDLGASHGWYVNRNGFLIQSPANPVVISRVWLPQTNGWTQRTDRYRYLGIPALAGSENAAVAPNVNPDWLLFYWTRSGWSDDPRFATEHYANLIDPRWTHAGLGRGAYGGGKKIAVIDFAEF